MSGAWWTRRRAPRGSPVVFGVLVAVIVLPYLGLGSAFVARSLGDFVSRRFLSGTGLSVSFEKLEGNPVRDVTIKGVKVHYQKGGASYDLFRADEVSCRFGVLALFKKDHRLDDLVVRRPELVLRTGPAGRASAPSAGKGGAKLPIFTVRRFSIEDGRVVDEGKGRTDLVKNLNLVGSARSGVAEFELRLLKGSAGIEDTNFVVKNLHGGVILRTSGEAGKGPEPGPARLFLDSLSVESSESAVIVSGMIVPATRLLDLAVSAEPIEVAEVARLMRWDTSHHGEVKGSFAIKGKPDRLRVTGRVDGVVSGYALGDFGVSLLREGASVRLDSLSGFLNGARIAGRGGYSLRAPNVLAVTADVRQLDLSKGFVPKQKLPETKLNGKIALTYRVKTEALAFSLDLGAGDFNAFPFERADVQGSYRGDTLTMDRMVVGHPTHTVTGRGTIVGGQRVSFSFHVSCAARDVLFKYFNIEQYRADADLDGTWQGTLDAWLLRLNGACKDFSYGGAFVPAGTVDLAIEEKNRTYDVRFGLDGPGCRIGPASFSGVSLSLEFRDDVTNITKCDLSGDEFGADVAADIRREGKGYVIRCTRCSLKALGDTWAGGGAFAVHVGDSLVRIEDIELRSAAGAASAQGTLNTKRRTIDGRFSFEGLGLELFNRSKLVSFPMSGTVRGSVRGAGSLSDPDLDIALSMEKGKVDTFAVDSMRLKAEYANGRCTLDSLLVASPSGAARVRGVLSGPHAGDLRKDPRAALGRAAVTIESSCRDLKMAPLLALGSVRAISDGKLSGVISITDSLMHPLVTFKGTVNNCAVSAFRFPVIDCDVEIGRQKLAAKGVLHVSPSHAGTFSGEIPLAPARFLYSLDRSRPVAFVVNLAEGDLAELPNVTDLVAEAAGRYRGDLSVTGTIASPHLNGELLLKGASFRLSGMEERYRDVNAAVLLEDTLVTVSGLTGKEGKKGTLSGGGSIALEGWKPARYHLTASVNDFVFASVPNVVAIASGNLNVSTTVEEGQALPALTGSCEVKESEIYYDLGSLSSSELAGTLEPPTWIAAIDLKIPGNTWVKTPDARVELQGNVTLYHDRQGTYLRGELDLLRGWYNIYNNKFNITSGKLQFVNAGTFRPVVDVEAETKDSEGRTIYLTLQWHQDDLQPRLTLRHEDPGYSETDIWKMLGGGVVGTSSKEGTSWDARGTAQNLAANYIERILNSQMEGLTIELESGTNKNPLPGLGDYKDTNIAIGKYLSQGLYVKYKQGLSITSARQIEVEYRISNLLLLRSEVIRHSDKVLQGKSPLSSDEVNLDFRLRWEF